MTMAEVRANGYWQYGLFGWMFGVFGAVALLLAASGVYGVISYSVTQRTQEFGVRLALGAQRSWVLRLVVRHALRLAAIGIAIGLVGALAVTRVLRSILVVRTDPVSFAGSGPSCCWSRRRRPSGPPGHAVDPIVALQMA
jgi:putative ABC transport system permease protein